MSVISVEQRQAAFMAEEAKNPLAFHWLSFCDLDRPSGKQFLGVVIVRERGFHLAFRLAHQLQINPGGEIQWVEIALTADTESLFDGYTERLITAVDAKLLMAKLGELP